MTDGAGAYPQRWETDVALSDGGIVHIRPVRPEDAPAVAAFHERQSADDVYLRYFTSMPHLTPRMLERLTVVDYAEHLGFVALLGDDIVGMGSYDLWPERGAAEVAFMVGHDQRGRGLATVLLEYLVVAAREAGIPRLVAMVLPSNRRMLSVFHKAGFEARSTFEDGVIEVVMGLDPTEEALAVIEERARRAEARSVARILTPGSIAVIGAGREPGGLGHELFVRLLRGGFGGPVYPVNPRGGHVASVRAWPSVLDIPDEVDLAVLAVPAHATLEVVDQCARKRVRGLVVTSAGFGPLGAPRSHLADALVERARRWGMRVVGPESLGAINTQWGVSMVATYSPVEVLPGRVGFLTQSGTLGVAALEVARRLGVGISTFVDVGRKVDVSGNDILQFWEDDPRTSVATLYLDSFGNPRKFVRIARRMARHTPIVAVKAGDLRPGGPVPPVDRRPGGPGPAADPAADAADWPAEITYGAMLAQAGVIRVDTLRDLFDVARTLLHQPVPGGRRVAVISNSRGATAVTLDACAAAGLELAGLGEPAHGALERVLPADGWAIGNPVELPFDAGPAEYEAALHAVVEDPAVDAVVVVYAPATRDRREEVGRAIGAVATPGVTVVATFLGAAVDEPLVSGQTRIPLFELPGEAVRVVGKLADHGAWRAEPPGTVPEPGELGIDMARARRVVDAVLVADPAGRWLELDEVTALADALGVPLVTSRAARSVEEAVAAAESIGAPVVLKAGGIDRYYPGEQGGVSLGLRHADDVREAHGRMVELLGAEAMATARVQATAPGGVDVLVAAHQHPSIGGVVTVGPGGIAAAGGQGSRPVQVLPVSDADADRLVARSPVAATLGAADPRGGAVAATAALVLRVAAAVDAIGELVDVVANPVIAGPDGATVTDLRVLVRPVVVDDRPAVRRLS